MNNDTDEHALEPMLERTLLAQLLKDTRTDLAKCRTENEGMIGEIKRLEGQIRQWSRANMALVARLTRTERELRAIKTQTDSEGTE